MKCTFDNMNNSSGLNKKSFAVLEGYIVAVTAITVNQNDKKGRHSTALICNQEQTICRLAKYLSATSNCCLHPKILEYFKNQNGIKLTLLGRWYKGCTTCPERVKSDVRTILIFFSLTREPPEVIKSFRAEILPISRV
jgi:hypothetical protein